MFEFTGIPGTLLAAPLADLFAKKRKVRPLLTSETIAITALTSQQSQYTVFPPVELFPLSQGSLSLIMRCVSECLSDLGVMFKTSLGTFPHSAVRHVCKTQ